MTKHQNLIFRPLQINEPLPMRLLLDADPDEVMVKAYCETGKVIIAEYKGVIVGVYVLEIGEESSEILNISIDENYQNQGFGKFLVKHAITITKTLEKKKIVVCTGNSSIGQIAFYQKCGFELMAIDKGYFTRNYTMPIIENGIACKDRLIFVNTDF